MSEQWEWLPAVGMGFLWVLSFGGSIFAVIFFRHPDDRKGSWGAKSVVVMALFSSLVGIFMLPLDVFNRNGGTVPMGMFWMVFAMWLSLEILIIIPWALVWYDSERTGFGSKLWGAMKSVFWILLIFGGLVGLCFHFYGTAIIPVKTLESPFTSVDASVEVESCGESCSSEAGSETHLEVDVSFPIYMVALIVLFGWLFLVFFGGIGLVTLPMDLMFFYYDRPQKIELEEYAKLRLATKERASKMIEFGKTLEADLSGRAMTSKQREMFNKLKAGAVKLEEDWEKINNQYNGTGPPLIFYQIVFGVGCAGAAVSALWVLHLGLYSVAEAATGKPVSPFLNVAFVGGDRVFPLVTMVLYTIFACWLLWAVLRGYTKIGLRVVSVPIHPLKKKGTYMNSMLFNTALIVCTALAVISFCAFNLDLYLRLTAADFIFTVLIKNLNGISPAWQVLHILLFVIVGITGIYFFLNPREPSMENQLDDDLQELLHPTGENKKKFGIF